MPTKAMTGEEEPAFTNRSNDPLRVFLNSNNAIRTGSHHYRFFLNIDAHYDEFDIYYHLRHLQTSYSWHQINGTNNTVSLNGEDYVIPPGNYSATELIETLNSHGTWNTLPITWSFNPNTAQVTLTADSAFSWGITTTAHGILGFTQVPSGSSTSFTSTTLVDVSPVKAVNFHLLSVPSRSFAVYDNQEISRFVCTVFVGNAQPYTTMSWTDDTDFKESTLQHALRFLEITVYDQDGIPVDLQNGSFQLELEFTFRPKKVWRLYYQ